MADPARLRRHIHAACRELGIDAETRRDLQLQATGKTSMSDMTAGDMERVVSALRSRGWRPAARAGRPPERRADQRFIWVLWGLLADAGVVTRGPAALRAFIANPNFAAKWGEPVSDVRFLSAERAEDVIEALKAMCARNGVELDR